MCVPEEGQLCPVVQRKSFQSLITVVLTNIACALAKLLWQGTDPVVASIRGGKFEEMSRSTQHHQYGWTQAGWVSRIPSAGGSQKPSRLGADGRPWRAE